MRRLLMTASLALVGFALARPVDAQISVGAQAAMITMLDEATDLNGTFGLGGRVVLSPPIPALSLGLIGQGVYYFPGDGLSYQTYGLSAKVGLGFPMISPYVVGGWQWRRSGADGFDSVTEDGAVAGLGAQLGMIPIFVEATVEFNEEDPAFPDLDNTPVVIQAGIMIGG